MTGETLSNDRFVEKIDEDGTGVACKAEECIAGRPVAIELIPAAAAACRIAGIQEQCSRSRP